MAWSDAARAAAAEARKRRAKIQKHVIKTGAGQFMTKVPGYSIGYGFKSNREALNNVRAALKAKAQYKRAKKAGKNPAVPSFVGNRRVS